MRRLTQLAIRLWITHPWPQYPSWDLAESCAVNSTPAQAGGTEEAAFDKRTTIHIAVHNTFQVARTLWCGDAGFSLTAHSLTRCSSTFPSPGQARRAVYFCFTADFIHFTLAAVLHPTRDTRWKRRRPRV